MLFGHNSRREKATCIHNVFISYVYMFTVVANKLCILSAVFSWTLKAECTYGDFNFNFKNFLFVYRLFFIFVRFKGF